MGSSSQAAAGCQAAFRGYVLNMCRAPNVAAACIGCLAFASPAAAHSGLRGKTTFGGQCGPAVSGEPPPVYRPFDVNVRIRSAETRALVRVIRSGRDGRFRVPLAPGTYIVEAGRPRERGVTY